jgi:tartrate-resistant acid phosphatase type 5
MAVSEVEGDVETKKGSLPSQHVARKYRQLDEDQDQGSSSRDAGSSRALGVGSVCRWSKGKGREFALVSSAVVLLIMLGLLSSYLFLQPRNRVEEVSGGLTVDRELRVEQVFQQYSSGAGVGREEDGGSFSFLVVGDWGRDGGYGQGAVASAMAKVAEDLRPNFVVSTGDNFYLGGLAGVNDEQFETSFTDVYSHASLQVPWLSVLGNHDYGDSGGCGLPVEEDDVSCLSEYKQRSRSPLHQMNPALRSDRDWRWFCERYFVYKPQPAVDMLFIDTSPFIQAYRNRTWATTVAGGISTQKAERQKEFIEGFLQKSSATRKIVIGHHPFYSNGFQGSNSELQVQLGAIFQQHNVTLYLNGHDHDLQHVHPLGRRTHFFTSGAGSKTGRGFGTSNTRFEYDSPGFASVSVGSDSSLSVRFHDAGANLLYEHKI